MLGGGCRDGRRGIPISAYVGPNGGGKSLAMVHDTLPTLEGIRWECENPAHEHTAAGVTAGTRRVLSTVQLLETIEVGAQPPVEDGEVLDGLSVAADGLVSVQHPLCDLLRSWRQLVRAEHCDVLLDEITGSAGSRGYGSLPPQMVQLFVQLRRRDVILRYTTPNWGRTDVVLREVTQAVTTCKGFFWERTPGLLWPSKRLFRWATYDAADWEEMSMQKVAKTKPLQVGWYWRPGRPAMLAYSTRDAVTTLDHVSEAGLCIECGGTRAKAKCTCATSGLPGPAAGGRPVRAGGS